ncbi:collagenase-like protease [Rivularia sp. PCC 7116]|uniref:U32 family peptidase n=1 Tax=Rivularia sp. PCC 7116 TaxID=373994 RepID=UPI00029EF655|nr:U32 family peptidase [Rivularia sp. PCC 7116]AFY53718.1 collagenase-like protease [Rivularia sp. PCC 7116]
MTTNSPQIPELLAPAGNWECAKAAVENGADAIYFGLDKFNARMRAENFTEADLPELMQFLHLRGVKGYVTLNTLIFPQELKQAQRYIKSIIAAGVDAVIVQDVGICRLIRHISPDFPIHTSTQMTVTSAIGVEFAKELGCNLVVLARECSIKEINKIQQQTQESSLPLEVFVHGALCVAYSGQCLTSEALGGRSANRGECAQACRMTYELIADGETINLGDRKYLLSPQDLAGLDVLPDLVKSGVSCLKIEGRLKSPEYVANVTKVYREALDGLKVEIPPSPPYKRGEKKGEKKAPLLKGGWGDREKYNLEMAFSRGIYTGWFEGINNQELVHARFGKKRGVYLGEVKSINKEKVTISCRDVIHNVSIPIKPGDGVVFDCGHPEAKEEGGRIYGVENQGKDVVLSFGKGNLNWRRIHVGDKLWKTSDPELDKQLRQSFAGDKPKLQRPIDIEVHGEVEGNLIAIARDEIGNLVKVESGIVLVEAHNKPLTTERLTEQFGRLGNTPFYLKDVTNCINGGLMLPVSELNKMRREIVTKLEELRSQPKRWVINENASLKNLLPSIDSNSIISDSANLIVLVRNLNQLEAALKTEIKTIYCEFEDPRKYREAVETVKKSSPPLSPSPNPPLLFVAPPRITKPSENWILQQVINSNADGYLIRNYDHLKFFADERCIGDFSLNVANSLTADYFKNRFHLERLTASYDLNIHQLQDLLKTSPPDWYEVTIHQHMPMFHMEHCVFCAFLSEGTDFRNCGRPCEEYEVKIKDRVGTEHVLQADAGCRNTVFNGTPQTGAEYVHKLLDLGLQNFRIEFVNEKPEEVEQTIYRYQQLLNGEIKGSQLWRELNLQSQLGVTRGTVGN